MLLPQSSTATQVRMMPEQSFVANSVKLTLTSESQVSVAVNTGAEGTEAQSTVVSPGSASTNEGRLLSTTVMVWTRFTVVVFS